MKKNIAVIYGGYSSEYQISVKSGKHVTSLIDTKLYNVFPVLLKGQQWIIDDSSNIQISKEDFSFQKNNEKVFIDCAVIMIHGTPGENGILESYLDLLRIPYTTCSSLVSAITFNKHYCNTYLRNYNVLMANSYLQRKGNTIDTKAIISKLGLPVFVKPAAGGSSFGVTKVKAENELEAAVQKAYIESDEVIIEEFISGTEVTCGLTKVNGQIQVFPLCEIVSKHEFFDFEAKYTPNLSDEIVPADISEELTNKCKKISSEIYDYLNCTGIVRMDFILKNNDFYFLEVNTIPGMTAESIVPKMVKYEKINITKLYSDLIEEAIKKNINSDV